MKIEVSIAEIVDKLSILEIKKTKILDSNKLINIKKEYDYLKNIVFNELKIEINDYEELSEINLKLWNIEDNIRRKEKLKEFDDYFIELARSVYISNDLRFQIKCIINQKYSSTFNEEKSY